MKTPDKIFIQRYSYGALLDGYSETPKKMAGGENIEFIRKDALLGWLEKTAEDYKKRSDEGELVWQQWSAFNQVIDKLNQL